MTNDIGKLRHISALKRIADRLQDIQGELENIYAEEGDGICDILEEACFNIADTIGNVSEVIEAME